MLNSTSLKWVESQPDENGFGGGGGAQWVEVSSSCVFLCTKLIIISQDNIEAWVNVAGSLLGRAWSNVSVFCDADKAWQASLKR